MLLTFSNSLENIHFLYSYKNIKQINPIFKDLTDIQLNDKDYFLINNENLIKKKKKLLFNKIFTWFNLNNKKINKNNKNKFCELSKKNLLYKKNLLILKKNDYFVSLSIIKNKYNNYLKFYKISSNIDFAKDKVDKINLDDIDNKISLGNLKTNLNKYNLITKKVFKNKYLLWGLKKTVFENRRFIKKKSISNRALGVLKLKELIEIENISTLMLMPVKQNLNYTVAVVPELDSNNNKQLNNLNNIQENNNCPNDNLNYVTDISFEKENLINDHFDINNLLSPGKNLDNININPLTEITNNLFKSKKVENQEVTWYEKIKENFKQFQNPDKSSLSSILNDLHDVEEEINRRRDVFFNWKYNVEDYYKSKLGNEKFLSFQIKFIEKYGQYMRKYLFFKKTKEIVTYLKNSSQPGFKKSVVKVQKLNKIDLSGEWGVAVYTPEKQPKAGSETTVFNYTNGSLLIKEIKTKRFNKKNKHKYHNILNYKAFTIVAPKKLVEISSYTQAQLKEEVIKLKTLVHQQTPEEREQLAHNLRVTFIKNFITFNVNNDLRNNNNNLTEKTTEEINEFYQHEDTPIIGNLNNFDIESNSEDDSLEELHESNLTLKFFKFDELSSELQNSDVNILDSFIKIDSKVLNLDHLDVTKIETLNSQVMKKILLDKNFTKKFLLNLKLSNTLKAQVKPSVFNFIVDKRKSKFKFLYLRLHLLNLKAELPQIISNDLYLNKKKSPFLNIFCSLSKSPKYKVSLALLYERNLEFLYNLSKEKKTEILKNFRSILISNEKHSLYKLTETIQENRILKTNYNFFNFKTSLDEDYLKLKVENEKILKDTIKFGDYKVEYFQDLIEKQKLYFFNFLLKKKKKYKLKKKNIKNYMFRKLNFIKKKYKNIKQLGVFFKSKILIFLHYNTNLTKRHSSQKTIISNYLWLNFKNYENYLLNFFFLQKKIINDDLVGKRKKTYFFNFRNKRLKTYRKARTTHWMSFTSKSINERRYQKFLDFFIKKPHNIFQYISVIFSFKFRLSYKFWSNMSVLYSQYYSNFSINNNKIFQLPIHLDFWYLLKHYDVDKQVVDQKILLWQTKRLKIKKTFWMQQKKKIPKFFKKKIFNVSGINNSLQYDFITNYFAILKIFKTPTHTNLFIFKNKYLKLHGFKYSS